MRPLSALAGYFILVFVGGALLAPWLYESIQWAGAHAGWARNLADNPFHRFVSRSLLGLAVIGLWPLARALGIQSWRDLGLRKPRGEWRRLGAGLALGFASLALVAIIGVAAGARSWDTDRSASKFLQRLASAAATAAIVAVLEEVVFRGALFGGLRRSGAWRVGQASSLSEVTGKMPDPLAGSWKSALVLSSGIYALVHFFDKPQSPEVVTWTSGFVTLGAMLRGFVELDRLVPGFFNLALAGAILSLAYQRTGSLYFSIGLHAGWIFWLKAYGFLTTASVGATSWGWGTRKLIDGWPALVVLGATLFACERWLLPRLQAEGKPKAEAE